MDLKPVAPPDLQPLRASHEHDQLEADMKAVFMKVLTDVMRDTERSINKFGMPHLGDEALVSRTLKEEGVAVVRRDAVQLSYLLKAARSRNERRGSLFIRKYLQSIWPNVWKIEQLWHPVNTADQYPTFKTPLENQDLGFGVTAEYEPELYGGIPTVYRTDWQGKQKLYPTPRTNLFVQSQGFSTGSWAKARATIVPNAMIGPRGTMYAAKLVEDTSVNNTHSCSQSRTGQPPGGTYTQYWDVKAGERTQIALRCAGTNIVGRAHFDIAAGVVLIAEAGITARILPLGEGFFRCIATFTVPPGDTAARGDLEMRNGGTVSYTGDGVSGVYPAECQLMAGTNASSYIATTTAPVTVTDYSVNAAGVSTFVTGPPPTALNYFLTGRLRITLPVSSDNGLGLTEVSKAFRTTLPARLMMELQLATVLSNIGNEGGLGLANGMHGEMIFYGHGKLT